MTIAVIPVDTPVDYGEGIGKLIRHQTKAIFTATTLEYVGDVPQCKIEFLQVVYLGGQVPLNLASKRTPKFLGVLKEVSKSFNRDNDVDKAGLASLTDFNQE